MLKKSPIGYVLGNDRLGGGLIALHSLLSLKEDTKTSDFQSNELDPIKSLYDHPFHKNFKQPRAYLTTLDYGLLGILSALKILFYCLDYW